MCDIVGFVETKGSQYWEEFDITRWEYETDKLYGLLSRCFYELIWQVLI
jgi:hypothetical protein